MVKFGKQFRKVQEARFELDYFDFKKFKQQLRQFLEGDSNHIEKSNASSTLNYPSFFISFFEEEVSKVVERYFKEVKGIKAELNKLLDKHKELKSISNSATWTKRKEMRQPT